MFPRGSQCPLPPPKDKDEHFLLRAMEGGMLPSYASLSEFNILMPLFPVKMPFFWGRSWFLLLPLVRTGLGRKG